MNTVDYSCPSCAHVLKMPAEYTGKSGTCNYCGDRISVTIVPHQDTELRAQAVDLPGQLKAATQRARSMTEFVDAITVTLLSWPECSKGTKLVLFLMDEKAGGLRLAQTRGHFSREFLDEEAFVPLGRCLCGRAAQSSEVLVCQECFKDPRHETRWLGMETHGHYVIPLKREGRVLGVLTLYTRAGVEPDEGRMAVLTEIGEYLGDGLSRLLQQEA